MVIESWEAERGTDNFTVNSGNFSFSCLVDESHKPCLLVAAFETIYHKHQRG